MSDSFRYPQLNAAAVLPNKNARRDWAELKAMSFRDKNLCHELSVQPPVGRRSIAINSLNCIYVGKRALARQSLGYSPKIRPSSMRKENWQLCLLHHGNGGATKDSLNNSGMTVGPHNNQICAKLTCTILNAFSDLQAAG